MQVHTSPQALNFANLYWIFVGLDVYDMSYFEIPYLLVMLEIKKYVTCISLCEVSAHTFGTFVCVKL